MAANKFATMLHRNTNRIVLILFYTVLEWILIFLLLLNSFFNYMIQRFADYFGLKPPCPLCSRVDHVFESNPRQTYSSYERLICESHAAEISRLCYCMRHQRLVESSSMCVDCSSDHSDDGSLGVIMRGVGFIPWVFGKEKQFQDAENRGPVSCSCCKGEIRPSFLHFKPSWRVLDPDKNQDLMVKEISDEKTGDGSEKEREFEQRNDEEMAADESQMLSDVESYGLSLQEASEEDSSKSFLANFRCKKREKAMQIHSQFTEEKKDDSFQAINPSWAQFTTCDLDRIISVELMDSLTNADHGEKNHGGHKDCSSSISGNGIKLHYLLEESESPAIDLAQGYNNHEVAGFSALSSEERYQASEQHNTSQAAKPPSEDRKCTQNPEEPPVQEQETEELGLSDDPSRSKLSVSAECSDNQTKNSQPESCMDGNAAKAANPSPTGLDGTEKGPDEGSRDIIETEKVNQEVMKTHEAAEETLPGTPTSLETLNYLDKKLLSLEKRDSGAEESIDGSAISEMESSDPIQTIERLKAALQTERRALRSLYSELEEERSASAVATNQTMAMITRLQEEKAAMQMEALQYQRMMEEQSEYDQEALQLMNELMVKREKEKQELESELEVYRKRALDYEALENTKGARKNPNACSSCSDSEDSDGLSIDLNREFAENGGNRGVDVSSNDIINLEEIALECTKHMSALDESLIEFEEERLAILEQLKALQEKLVSVEDDGFQEIPDYINGPQEKQTSGDLLINNGNYSERLSMASMAKSLLPLLDTAEKETDDGEDQFESSERQEGMVSNNKLDDTKEAIIEQVDSVYERLQSLETDGEFLKHCMSSVTKGDKGMDLLQEILQHLRDLKAIELRESNVTSET